jgi:hypothetical protein
VVCGAHLEPDESEGEIVTEPAHGTADYWTLEAMSKYGGSFVQALAVAYRRADDVNRARLLAAFPDYFAEYATLAGVARKVEP